MPRAVRIASQEYWRPADPSNCTYRRPILAEGLCARLRYRVSRSTHGFVTCADGNAIAAQFPLPVP